jgi:predicted RNA polymerase sigma factor
LTRVPRRRRADGQRDPEIRDQRTPLAEQDVLRLDIAVNHAVAVAMSQGSAEGLRLLDALDERKALRDYYLLPSARADLLRRMERWPEAETAYRQALGLTNNGVERRFLERRLREVRGRQEQG